MISRRAFLISLVVISFLIPVYLGNFKLNSSIEHVPYENALGTNEISKDDYSAILSNEEYGLGNVTIDDLHFESYRAGFINHSVDYPLIDADIASFALFYVIESIEFVETISPATIDNLNNINKNIIAIKLNESLHVYVNNTIAGYLVYFSYFFQAKLQNFYIDNGTSIKKLTEDSDYFINNRGYLVFNYEDYFQQGPIFNFTMHLIWDYDVELGDWTLDQREETPLIMSETEQEFTSKFTYQFFLVGFSASPDLVLPGEAIYHIVAALTITPLEKELLTYQDLIINLFDVNINNYVNADNSLSIEISDQFKLNRSFISLNFTCSFGLKFEKPVEKSWAIDRLVGERNLRERIYIISMTNGPRYIFLKNVALYDTGIFVDQVVDAYSLFNRDVEFFDANASVPRQLGLKMNMPYLIFGETCPFSIQYRATQTLDIIITDTIKMPLVGANIEILHFGVKYGTYVSNESVQPINPGTTDENGQIRLYDVPRGNYTVRVIWQGKVVTEATVTTDKEVNYVFTSIPHFPLWILIFGMISGILLVAGALFYLKYNKLR